MDPGRGAIVDHRPVNDFSPLENQIPVGDAKCERQMLLDDDHRCADLVTKTLNEMNDLRWKFSTAPMLDWTERSRFSIG
jgi:hypothetical protein